MFAKIQLCADPWVAAGAHSQSTPGHWNHLQVKGQTHPLCPCGTCQGGGPHPIPQREIFQSLLRILKTWKMSKWEEGFGSVRAG